MVAARTYIDLDGIPELADAASGQGFPQYRDGVIERRTRQCAWPVDAGQAIPEDEDVAFAQCIEMPVYQFHDCCGFILRRHAVPCHAAVRITFQPVRRFFDSAFSGNQRNSRRRISRCPSGVGTDRSRCYKPATLRAIRR